MTHGTYRFFYDHGHAWLEVPRIEVITSGATISQHSTYDQTTDMVYLEEDDDMQAFLEATDKSSSIAYRITAKIASSQPRKLPAYHSGTA